MSKATNCEHDVRYAYVPRGMTTSDKAECCACEVARLTAEIARLTTEANALGMTCDEYEEISSELFALCESVLDGRPDASAARDGLAEHMQHVRECRMGACEVALGNTARAEVERLTIENKLLEDRIARAEDDRNRLHALVVAVGCECGYVGGNVVVYLPHGLVAACRAEARLRGET